MSVTKAPEVAADLSGHLLRRVTKTVNYAKYKSNGEVEWDVEEFQEWVHPATKEGKDIAAHNASQYAAQQVRPWPAPQQQQWAAPINWQARQDAMAAHPAGKGWVQDTIPGLEEFMDAAAAQVGEDAAPSNVIRANFGKRGGPNDAA